MPHLFCSRIQSEFKRVYQKNTGNATIQLSSQQFRNVGYFTTFRPGRSILVAVEPLEIEWLGR
jgi:hypothetical protein